MQDFGQTVDSTFCILSVSETISATKLRKEDGAKLLQKLKENLSLHK